MLLISYYVLESKYRLHNSSIKINDTVIFLTIIVSITFRLRVFFSFKVSLKVNPNNVFLKFYNVTLEHTLQPKTCTVVAL